MVCQAPRREDKDGHKRTKDSFIHYYLCAKQQKEWKGSDHKNCASASKTENWVWEKLRELATSEGVIEASLEAAYSKARVSLEPVFEAYKETGQALNKVECDIEKVLETASSGQAIGALWDMLNERAFRLKWERDRLLVEQRRLKEQLLPAETSVDSALLCTKLLSLDIVRRAAYPDELKRLLRLMVRRIEWAPGGGGKVQLFALPCKNQQSAKNQQPAHFKSGQAGVSYYDALRYPVGESNP